MAQGADSSKNMHTCAATMAATHIVLISNLSVHTCRSKFRSVCVLQ